MTLFLGGEGELDIAYRISLISFVSLRFKNADSVISNFIIFVDYSLPLTTLSDCSLIFLVFSERELKFRLCGDSFLDS